MKGNKNNSKLYKFISPSGEELVVNGFYKFCEDNKLLSSTMEKVLKTGKPALKGNCKGWLVYKLQSKKDN